jgi:hypothetical protein
MFFRDPADLRISLFGTGGKRCSHNQRYGDGRRDAPVAAASGPVHPYVAKRHAR